MLDTIVNTRSTPLYTHCSIGDSADTDTDSLRMRQRDPQSTRHVFGGSRVAPKMPAAQTPKSTLVPSQVPSRLRAPDCEAYKCNCADKARKPSGFGVVASETARSCRKALDGSSREARLPRVTSQISATTNAIESTAPPQSSRNVKRWRVLPVSPTALGVVTAEKKFHRIKGYRHMGALVHALRSKQKSLDSDEYSQVPPLDQIQQLRDIPIRIAVEPERSDDDSIQGHWSSDRERRIGDRRAMSGGSPSMHRQASKIVESLR